MKIKMKYIGDGVADVVKSTINTKSAVILTELIKTISDYFISELNTREIIATSKRKEKLQKQLKDYQEYNEKIARLALSQIEIDLDDGVKVNYEKVQTAKDGKKYQVLAKI